MFVTATQRVRDHSNVRYSFAGKKITPSTSETRHAELSGVTDSTIIYNVEDMGRLQPERGHNTWTDTSIHVRRNAKLTESTSPSTTVMGDYSLVSPQPRVKVATWAPWFVIMHLCVLKPDLPLFAMSRGIGNVPQIVHIDWLHLTSVNEKLRQIWATKGVYSWPTLKPRHFQMSVDFGDIFFLCALWLKFIYFAFHCTWENNSSPLHCVVICK